MTAGWMDGWIACLLACSWLIGGGYKDATSVQRTYNDVHVLNLDTLQWEAVSLLGDAPSARWSHSAVRIGPDRLALLNGCDETQWFADLYVLRLGVTFAAHNARITQMPAELTAGRPASFVIEARDSTPFNGSAPLLRSLSLSDGCPHN
jgi:hypothetical protein